MIDFQRTEFEQVLVCQKCSASDLEVDTMKVFFLLLCPFLSNLSIYQQEIIRFVECLLLI